MKVILGSHGEIVIVEKEVSKTHTPTHLERETEIIDLDLFHGDSTATHPSFLWLRTTFIF